MLFAREGWPFIITPIAIGVLLLFIGRGTGLLSAGWVLVVLGLFCLFFFRDPQRVVPVDANLILSPCDGKVMEVTEENGKKVVRVFLSVFNVHLQRSPVEGVVKSVEYRPGKFLPAMNKEAHVVNEQNVITLQTPQGEYVVYQIAGILARRVVSWVKPGDSVAQGQRIGLIKFGSQVDLVLPAATEIRVRVGEKVVGGISVVGAKK